MPSESRSESNSNLKRELLTALLAVQVVQVKDDPVG